MATPSQGDSTAGGLGWGFLGRPHSEGVVKDREKHLAGGEWRTRIPGGRHSKAKAWKQEKRSIFGGWCGRGPGVGERLERQQGRSLKGLLLSAEGGWSAPSGHRVKRISRFRPQRAP